MTPAFIPITLPTPHAPRHQPSPKMCSPPPEGRISPNFPPERRYKAPVITLSDIPDFSRLNKLGVAMPVIPLDIPAAVKLLAKAGANAAVQTGNPNLIFTGDITDPTGETPADVFYPALRRDDAPIIEFVEGGVRISVGKVHAGEAPGADPDSEADAIAAREGAFWKKPGSRDAESIVNENYGKVIRHMAPIIEFKEREGDVFGFSLGMGKVTGELVDTEVPAGLYPEKDRFYAPLIQLNPPAYENDASSYVKVSSAEVQLPIVEAVSLRSSM